MMELPQTLEEAKKVRYRQWAGFPRGNPFHPERCAYEVMEKGRGMLTYQCQRKPGYGPENLYCKQHAKRAGVTNG